MIETLCICKLFALLIFGSFESLCNANHRPPLLSEAMISHTYNSATMENLYPRPSPFARYRRIIMRKAVQVWHCLLQNKNSRLALLPRFYGDTAGSKTDRRQLGQNWSSVFRKRTEMFRLKSGFMSYVIPAAQSALLSKGRTKREKEEEEKLSEPLLFLGVQTRAGPLWPYMEGWMTSPASGAVLFRTTSTFFIVQR